MSRRFVIKRKQQDPNFPRLYRACLRGVLWEESQIMGPVGSGMFAKELTYLVMLYNGLYRLPNVSKTKGRLINAATEYVANLDIIVTYILNFHTTNKKIFPLLSRAFRLSALYTPVKVVTIEGLITEFQQKADSLNRNPDQMSGIAGSIFSTILNWQEDDEYAKDLEQIGYYLGKYTYLANSYVNLRRDEKKGYYNPLIFAKRKDPEVFETYIRQTIRSQADACMDAFSRLPIDERYESLSNALAQYFASQYLQR